MVGNTNKKSLLAWLLLLAACRLTSPLSSLVMTCALLPPSPTPTIPSTLLRNCPHSPAFCPTLTIKYPLPSADPIPPSVSSTPPHTPCLWVPLQFKLSLSFILLSKHHFYFMCIYVKSSFPLKYLAAVCTGISDHVTEKAVLYWIRLHKLLRPT